MPIRKRGERYQVRVTLARGQRVERTLPAGATRADAKAVEAALTRRAIDHAAGREPERLIDDALDRWVRESAAHLKSYQKDLRYRIDVVRGYTREKTLDAIPDVAQAIISAGRTENLSAAAINRYLAILRRIGNLALRWGWTEKALGARIELLAGERQRHEYLTVDQVRALAKAAGGEAGDAILMAALTGLRRGELLRLTPEMIQGDVIVLDAQTKSGRPRAIPMPQEAARIARKRLPWTLREIDLRYAFEDARTAVGVPGVRFHDLRHTYASWLVQSGAGLTHVRDLLGHSSLAVTSRYSHLAAEHLRGVVAALPRVLQKGRKRA